MSLDFKNLDSTSNGPFLWNLYQIEDSAEAHSILNSKTKD